MKSFVGIYDDVLSEDQCKDLIGYFHNNPTCDGYVWFGGEAKLLPKLKKSTELDRCAFSNHKFITDIISPVIVSSTNDYVKEYDILNTYSEWSVDDDFTFKKFEGEDEGFKTWHTEHNPGLPSSRILVYNFYLNNAQSGTEFKYYPTVDAKRGRLVIWPASWTHFHRSEPNRGLKYIISGWYSFKT